VVGVALAVVGLACLVFGLLEWPPLGASHPIVIASLAVGVVCLVALVVVESRVKDPMLPLGPFASRSFSLANVLTLLLYAALGVMMFLLPLNMIQVQGYTPTAAGSALVPFAVIMFVLSRWSGGLVGRIGARLPLTIGPAVVAVGFVLLARIGESHSYWSSFFPAIVVMGFGMAITVAPLTTTVMNSVDSRHSGVASGVNNAVSRVAGLLAIAAFGVVLSATFNARVEHELPQLAPPVRQQLERERSKMAGADVSDANAKHIIRAAFLDGYDRVMLGAVILALLAAASGAMITESRSGRRASPGSGSAAR